MGGCCLFFGDPFIVAGVIVFLKAGCCYEGKEFYLRTIHCTAVAPAILLAVFGIHKSNAHFPLMHPTDSEHVLNVTEASL